MKVFLIFVAGLFIQGVLRGAEPLPGNRSLSMCSGGEVMISGQSNIGGFHLVLELKDSFVRPANTGGDARVGFYHRVVLPVDQFEGRNQQMKKDFMELVKASVYPEIHITLEKMNRPSNTMEQVEVITGIRIAGEVRTYAVPCRTEYRGERLARIEGSREIDIRDFNLEVPSRFFGLIKIREQISIQFWITFV